MSSAEQYAIGGYAVALVLLLGYPACLAWFSSRLSRRERRRQSE